ncbi:uncharacterized protein LOC131022899 [Salvia miltiorrhiza]|uniref:uncharacterized protein LOC131022899 n=1 Tax=Salvia miltiorrhiza TaxID=226208 RepID=UPI0025AC7C56|nr:uncharacterized protein LOC131022899 [Salvia miltiorrhiza]
MSSRRVAIRHGGHWERSNYIGGDEVLLYMPVGLLSYDNLVRGINEQLDCDESASDYLFHYLMSMSDGRRTKVALKSDTDFFRLLLEQNDYPVVYVVKKGKQPTGDVENRTESRCFGDGKRQTVDAHAQIVSSDDEVVDKRREEIVLAAIHEFTGWIRQPGHLEKMIGNRKFSSDDHDFDSTLPLNWAEPSFPDKDQLAVNATFRSKDELAIAVGLYHMEKKVEYAVDRSTTERVGYICKHDDECPFMLRAVQEVGLWRIIKFIPNHTCRSNLTRTAPRMVPSRVVAAYFSRKLSVERIVLKPKEMMDEMLRLFGIQMGYKFALRSRDIALEMMYGGFEQSYQRLPTYLYLLGERNTGTIYDVQTTQTGEFRYMFLALGQSIHAFQNHLRPVIVVDGTHLKGKNKGVLFVAVTKDGNEGVFPLAIGLGPIENDESWTYFFSMLRASLGDPPDDLLIVSDQHTSIRSAIESIYPNVAHGLCFYHIQKNLARFGRHVAEIYKNAAYSYRHEVFNLSFAALEAHHRAGAYKRLTDIGVERWARSKCPVRRYSFMTSNAAESMNARLLWARRLPVCAMLEVYRSTVEQWFDQRRAEALARDHEMTKEAFRKLSLSVESGRRYTVRGTTTHVFKVELENKTTFVDLQSWTCDCREFDLDMIPCRHACAAIRHANLNVYDFVGRYFKQHALLQTYAARVEPVPQPDTWDVPTSVSGYIIRPPVIKRQSGRPKDSRAQSHLEKSSSTTPRQICGRCKGHGHNRRSCAASLPTEDVDPQPQKGRQKKKCTTVIVHRITVYAFDCVLSLCTVIVHRITIPFGRFEGVWAMEIKNLNILS